MGIGNKQKTALKPYVEGAVLVCKTIFKYFYILILMAINLISFIVGHIRLAVPLFLIGFGMSVSTQSFAKAVHYDPRFLGTPIAVVGDTSYYWFWKVIPWWRAYHQYVPNLFTITPIVIAVICSLAFLFLLRKKAPLSSHGTARWAEYADLLKMDLISGAGVTVGLYDDSIKRGLTTLLRKIELIKNEKVAYDEMEFDQERDRMLDKCRRDIYEIDQKLELSTTEDYRKKLVKKKIELNKKLADPPRYDNKAHIKVYMWVWLYKKLTKLYAKIPHFYLRDNSNKHLAVIAPTRSGKGVGLIIPTLLGSWKSSVIVNDIKSENWGVTAGYRKKMGHTVIKFEPTASDGSSARWNPIDEIPLGHPLEVSMAQNLAAVLADYEGKGKPDHWTANAATVITCVILHMKYAHYSDPEHYPHPPSLFSVASFMKASLQEVEVEVEEEEKDANGNTVLNEAGKPNKIKRRETQLDIKGFVDTLKGLIDGFEHVPAGGVDFDEWDPIAEKYVKRHFTQADLKKLYPGAQSLEYQPGVHPIIFQSFAEITSKPDNELGSIVSTANTALKEYLDPVLAQNTSVSDFSIDDIMNYKKPVSLYLVTPPSDLLRLAPIFRLFFEMMVRHHARSIGTYVNGQAKSQYKHKCLFLMDEFSSLGNLQSFAATLSYIAGYGMKVFLINQGLPQINGIYGKDNQILMNCHLQIFYAPNDNDTAKYAESLLGNKTIETVSRSSNGGFFNTSRSTNQTGRVLMTSDELMRLGDKEIIRAAGAPPVLTDKIKYYENDYFLKRLVQAPLVSDIIRNDPVKNKNEARDALLAADAAKKAAEAKAKENPFVYDDTVGRSTADPYKKGRNRK